MRSDRHACKLRLDSAVLSSYGPSHLDSSVCALLTMNVTNLSPKPGGIKRLSLGVHYLNQQSLEFFCFFLRGGLRIFFDNKSSDNAPQDSLRI